MLKVNNNYRKISSITDPLFESFLVTPGIHIQNPELTEKPLDYRKTFLQTLVRRLYAVVVQKVLVLVPSDVWPDIYGIYMINLW